MKVTTEKPEPGVATLTVEVPAEDLDRAVDQAWRRLAARVNIPGFRRGKAPRPLIERQVGVAAIDEEALRRILPERYDAAVDEARIAPIERPQFDVVQLERGKPLIFKATVAIRPTVELGNYRSIRIEPEAVAVTDEEVKGALERLRESQAQWVPVEDRGLELGDLGIVDLQIDFPGEGEGERRGRTSKRQDAEVILGANPYPEGFDERLRGARPGETREFTLSWRRAPASESAEGPEGSDEAAPETHTAAFTVHVKDVKRKEVPALDDAFARSLGDHDTLAALERDVRRRLYDEAVRAARVATENNAIEAAVAQATYEIPARLIDAEAEALAQERQRVLAEQRLTLERYLQFLGTTQEAWREELRDQAARQIKARLVLEQVAEQEQIAVSPAEVEAEIARTAEAYGEQAHQVRRSLSTAEARGRIAASLRRQQAIARLVDYAGGYPKNPLAESGEPPGAPEPPETAEEREARGVPEAADTTAPAAPAAARLP